MKIKLFIIGLAISLMSTKCAEKPVYISFVNESNKNIIFSCTKNFDTLKHILKKTYSYHFRVKEMSKYHLSPVKPKPLRNEMDYSSSYFKYLMAHSKKKDRLSESDLYYLYSSKGKSYYTFYFLRVKKIDTINQIYMFNKIYDSINISKDKIKIGDGVINSFLYDRDKIVFKSKELD